MLPADRDLSAREPGSAGVPAAARLGIRDHLQEWELLLGVIRSQSDRRKPPAFEPEGWGGLDWSFLIETANHHRILPLLHNSVVRVERCTVPADATRRLRAAFEANVRRSLVQTRELLHVVDEFQANGISVIPYKGPLLALQLYGDAGLRQFSDLDVLVPVNDVSKARMLLMSRGYRSEPDMTEQQLRSFIRREKDVTLLQSDSGMRIELHWGIAAAHDPVRVPPEFIWRHVRTYSFAGRPILTLTSEALLLILCVHGARHQWEKLVWLGDIAAIIRSSAPLDWDRVIDDAIALGCNRILGLGLSLAHGFLDVQLPPRALNIIEADSGLVPLVSQVKHHVFSNSSLAPTLGEPERFLLHLQPHRRDRLRTAFSQIRRYAAPTTRDEETLPVPGSLKWLLYVVRPVRLAWEYGLMPLRRLLRGVFQT